MKRLMLASIMLCSYAASACDACGSSGGSQAVGLLPQYYRHFAGVQYQYRSFNSMHDAENKATTSHSQEQYQIIQLWGKAAISKRVMLFGFMPYTMNTRAESNATTHYSGLGDASVITNVMLLKSSASSASLITHILFAGVGIKAPTGKHDVINTETGDRLLNIQPGTGSWDILSNVNYTLLFKKMGVNTEASYTVTNPNKQDYKYGNRLSAAMLYFYKWQKKDWSVIPQAGMRYEYTLHDYDNYSRKWLNEETGGSIMFGSLGLQAYYKHYGFQLSYYTPLVQNYAQGNVTATTRSDIGVLILF
ncbi:MAG: hypothetical protein JST82_00690 [Bacteroidetes bacterium]|nr:hypothetical protein [Bacteroidota bacterium]